MVSGLVISKRFSLYNLFSLYVENGKLKIVTSKSNLFNWFFGLISMDFLVKPGIYISEIIIKVLSNSWDLDSPPNIYTKNLSECVPSGAFCYILVVSISIY